MLIGIDASRAVIGQRTGTENYSYHLIRHLLAQPGTHRYRLYFNQPPTPDLFRGGEQRVIPFPRLWTQLRLSWEMWRDPPEALFVPAHVLPLLHPPRSIVTVHDLGYLYHPEAHTRRARLYLDLSTRYNAHAAQRVIADSATTRDDLVRHYRVSTDKITVVYPGCGEEFAPIAAPGEAAALRARYGLPEDYILYVGTLHPRKNLVRLVEAYAMLNRPQGPSSSLGAYLVIAGKKGWLYRRIFARVEELGLRDQVFFPGYIAQEDLPALLRGASVFVMPSLYEGFGLPVLEAMACGTPVICSNSSSLPEVAGDAALLVEPTDVAALAEALHQLLTDAMLREELRARGFRQAARFTWAGCAQEALRVIIGEGHERRCTTQHENAAEGL